MFRVLPTSTATPPMRRAVLAVLVVAGLALTACTSGGSVTPGSPVAHAGTEDPPGSNSSSQAPSTPSTPDAVISTPGRTTGVNPAAPVKVTVADGTLTSVSLRNPEGVSVKGALADDGTSWTSSEVLGYSKTYTLMAVATNADGKVARKTAQLTTLTPSNFTMPYLNTTGGQSLHNGAIYGVGIVPVVHFDEPITNRAAAEKALIVDAKTRGGHTITGVWYWVDAQNVHWRPKLPTGTYLPTGAHITVTAKVYGVQVGDGLYGQADQSVSFTIGQKRVSIADDKTHTVKVYFDDHLVRTMPTSMGQHMSVEGTNGPVSLWTMSGTYTVIGKENPATMSSASFGLPVNSPYGYAPEKVYLATRISTDGIYLHSAPWSVGQQGFSDVSHGCLNLSPENAEWYYSDAHSRVGDVVIVKPMGGPKIQVWQNGDWSVPWSQWVAGSALH